MISSPVSLLSRLECQFTLRPYQQRAIEVVERRLAEGAAEGRKCHIVAPPGSGKTVLGLELIRRLAAPAIILSPNAAIQHQWSDKIRFFLPQDGSLSPDEVVAEAIREPLPPILSLTYQSLAVATRETELLDELAHTLWVQESGDAGRIERLREANQKAYHEEKLRFRARVRRRLAEEPDFDITSLLHDSVQALMAALVARGTRTVILDECHHLTGMWAIIVGALLERLQVPVVIGLTATPPVDRSQRDRIRYLDLVGEIDFEVPTPAVVRDGNLAPYQDLVYLTSPTREEMQFVAGQHAHWSSLQQALNAGGRLDDWIAQRVGVGGRDPTAWEKLQQRSPTLAASCVRWLLAHERELPDFVKLTREMIELPTLEDRLRLIADFALGELKLSEEPADRKLYQRLKSAGRTLGYNLTESGFRRTTAPVDRLLSLSRAKQEATLEILRHEWEAMGERLRAVVITDFERSSATVLRSLSGVLDPDAESALGMMRLLACSDLEEKLRPVLVTGRTLLCEDTIAPLFMEQAREWFARRGLTVSIEDEAVEGASFHRIRGTGPDWRTGSYVAMVTSLLERGVTRCLVGTRALLGEGWDSLSLNTFIDLTYATTFASVNQLRGRAIRLDPAWPEKVANNWDVVCIAPGYEKGMQDYERFARKHEAFFGVADDGNIELGVGHVHPLLQRLSDAELGAARHEINQEMIERARDRAGARRLWQVGEPYENIEVIALDLRYPEQRHQLCRVGRARRQEALRPATQLAALGTATVAAIALAPLIGSLGGGLLQAWLEAFLSGGYEVGPLKLGVGLTWLLLSISLIGRSALLLLRAIGQRFWSEDGESIVRAMAVALLESLQATEQLPLTISPDAIHLSESEGGYVRVWLEHEEAAQVEQFSRAMAELLGPVTDEFRYMIPRYELILPEHGLGRLWRWLQWVTNRWVGEVAAWHPVPHDLGLRAERVRVFEESWQRHVSPGEALFLQRASVLDRLRDARRLPSRIERRTKRIWR